MQFIRVEKALKLKTKELELARVEDELRLRKSGAWFVAGPAAGAVPATGSSTDVAPTTGTAACATTVRAGAAVSSVPKSAAPVTGSADGAAPAPGAAISKKPKQGRGPYKKVSAVVPLYSEYHEKSWDWIWERSILLRKKYLWCTIPTNHVQTPRITDEAEREGVKAMVKAIGEAFQRAKLRTEVSGKRDGCLLYTSPSPRDGLLSRMPSSA